MDFTFAYPNIPFKAVNEFLFYCLDPFAVRGTSVRFDEGTLITPDSLS